MNYREWTSEVRRFSESLKALRGKVEASIEIDPPLTELEIGSLAEKWEAGLPLSVRDLWLNGSSRIHCPYAWTPTADEIPLLRAIFDSSTYLVGGVRFRSAQEVFPGNADLAPDSECLREIWGDQGFELWSRCAIILDVGNGDCVALDPERNPEDPAVVYLLHDGEDSGYIAPSFSEFLKTWTELSFIGPELWLLDPWLDQENGRIDPSVHKTSELRNLLNPNSRE